MVVFQRTFLNAVQHLAGTVSEALVKVHLQLVGLVAVPFGTFDLLIRIVELLHHPVLHPRLVVSVHQVFDGDGLGAVLFPYPVGVGQVDADGGGGVAVSTELRHHDGFRLHALHRLLLEHIVDGGIILKPLGVLTDDDGTFGADLVLEVGQSLPRRLLSERVGIDLNEAVDVVHLRLCVLGPEDVVVVPCFEVAGTVELDEFLDVCLLGVIFRHLGGFLQPIGNFLYLFGIQHGERHFGDFPVLFYHLAGQSVGDWPFRIRAGIRGLQVGIVPFYLLLGDPFVEVDGGVGHKVLAGVLREAFGRHLRIVDDVQKLGAGGFVEMHRAVHQLAEILFRTFGKKLVVGVVVVHPVREPEAFGIDNKLLPVLAGFVAAILGDDSV